MRLAGGLMGRFGDDTAAVFEVRGEHAVVSGEMGAGARHRASSLRERHFRGGEAGDAKSAGLPICTAGGCPEGVRHTDVPHEFHRVEHDMSGPVVEGVLESIHDLPAVIDREAFVRDCWAGDVAAKAFERVPLMGSAARADPRLHHSGGYGGRIPRASDAGVGRRRVGRDGAQGQGLAPGVRAGGDAVVDGGTEELSNPSSGSRSREAVSSSRINSPCLSRARVTRAAMVRAAGAGVQAGSGRSHGASGAVPRRTCRRRRRRACAVGC